MTAPQYKAARESIGTQGHVAKLLGVHRVTIAKREAGTLEISEEAKLAMESLAKRKPLVLVEHERERLTVLRLLNEEASCVVLARHYIVTGREYRAWQMTGVVPELSVDEKAVANAKA